MKDFTTISELELLKYARNSIHKKMDELEETIDKKIKNGKPVPEWMNEEDALLSAQDEEISHRIVDLKELARWEASTPISKGEALKAWCDGKEDKLMWCGKSIPQYAYGYCQLASNKTEQFYLGLKRMLEMWDGNLPPEEFRILEQA